MAVGTPPVPPEGPGALSKKFAADKHGDNGYAKAKAMQERVNGSPIVQCPGCNQPMAPKQRKPAPKNTRLVDVLYICPTCEMETTRTVSE